MLLFYRKHKHIVKNVRFDKGTAENSLEFKQYLAKENINWEPASVDHQEQNPVERNVQTLIKGTGALLIDQFS